MNLLYIFLIFLSFHKQYFCQSYHQYYPYKLELVQVLLRHGERTATEGEIYPTDPYDEVFKEVGYGQLTKIGMHREYKLGLMLKNRYNHFLGETKFSDFHATSTNTDRTKMSLQLALAGVNLPSVKSRWSYDLNWTPVPWNYVDTKVDFLQTANCDKYQEELQFVQSTERHKSYFEDYRDFAGYLQNATGLTLTKLFSIYLLGNNLNSVVGMGLPLPKWCSWSDYDKFLEIRRLVLHLSFDTDRLKRIVAGPTIEKILENIENQEAKKSTVKMYLYSAHDTNIVAMFESHNITVPEKVVVDYGSSIIVEKLRGMDGKIFLRLLYWTGVSGKLLLLKLPNCETVCPIEKYKKIIKTMLPDEETRNCYSTESFCRDLDNRDFKLRKSEEYIMAGRDFVSFKYPKSFFVKN